MFFKRLTSYYYEHDEVLRRTRRSGEVCGPVDNRVRLYLSELCHARYERLIWYTGEITIEGTLEGIHFTAREIPHMAGKGVEDARTP